jgi:hypothetical protein
MKSREKEKSPLLTTEQIKSCIFIGLAIFVVLAFILAVFNEGFWRVSGAESIPPLN